MRNEYPEPSTEKKPRRFSRPAVLKQPHVHPAKPVWWTRTKNPDGTWKKVPYYGRDAKSKEEIR